MKKAATYLVLLVVLIGVASLGFGCIDPDEAL